MAKKIILIVYIAMVLLISGFAQAGQLPIITELTVDSENQVVLVSGFSYTMCVGELKLKKYGEKLLSNDSKIVEVALVQEGTCAQAFEEPLPFDRMINFSSLTDSPELTSVVKFLNKVETKQNFVKIQPFHAASTDVASEEGMGDVYFLADGKTVLASQEGSVYELTGVMDLVKYNGMKVKVEGLRLPFQASPAILSGGFELSPSPRSKSFDRMFVFAINATL